MITARISGGLVEHPSVQPGPPTQPPPRLDHHEKMRIRAAAFRATRLYRGPVGELLSRELLSWEEFGYRLHRGGLIMRLVDHLMTTAEQRA